MKELFDHQRETVQFLLNNPRAFVLNDPGTGKTASALVAVRELMSQGWRRALILAPKAILEPSWAADCREFTPELSVATAFAKNRMQAFSSGADIVVTNHDAVNWIHDNLGILDTFDIIIIDESTAYKNRAAKRSKRLLSLIQDFPIRVAMTGTPMPNTVQDIWHQALLIDDGERLGNNFFRFRATTCTPTARGAYTQWDDRAGAQEAVADLLSDISIRFKFEDCIDIPPNFTSTVEYDLNQKTRDMYNELLKECLLQFENDEVTAVNAAVLVGKLLQIASGAVYSSETAGKVNIVDTERYELIAELCSQRKHSVVAYQWGHQRDLLIEALERAGINRYCVVNNNITSGPDSTGELVKRFQAGEYQVCLAHPKSASHGLTLTRATTTIWASPTHNAEHFEQFNRRIYRTSQTQRTETIRIVGRDTVDAEVYANLDRKLTRQLDLLSLLKRLSEATRSLQ